MGYGKAKGKEHTTSQGRNAHTRKFVHIRHKLELDNGRRSLV